MISAPFIIDTFTEKKGAGNPTAVCIVEGSATDAQLLTVAAKLQLPVTAFVMLPSYDQHSFYIRYFTTITEIPACGHATLAAAKLMLGKTAASSIKFKTISNIEIIAVEENDIVWLDYPFYVLKEYLPEEGLLSSMDIKSYVSAGICEELESLFIELDDPILLRKISPSYHLMVKSNPHIKEVVITSRSDDPRYDFLLRSFCPWIGIDEDPVTGSVHSILAGFWEQRLGKKNLFAYQASPEGGEVYTQSLGTKVRLGGKTVMIT